MVSLAVFYYIFCHYALRLLESLSPFILLPVSFLPVALFDGLLLDLPVV
jgi:hypothetical protein